MKIVKGCFVCIVLLVLFGCSQETAVTKITMAQTKSGLNNSKSLDKPKDESPIKVVGNFTNVKVNGEHSFGYSVNLWKQEEKVCGLISGSDTLRIAGDPPTGILENVQFDAKTKKISFRAKLSLGKVYDKKFNGEWSKDVYEFEGVLMNKELRGKLIIKNELYPTKPPENKEIRLRLSETLSSAMSEYKNRSEWLSQADKILEFRGPKW